ncbi:keratin, type I cytoskeletal 10-like [Colias croceus]|uniref:keratin, type I cytoskeletal 10-like n=1 Tax=Colias crocea TaxID=72248 RepID=UPI001E27C6DB|nr:keratin, type I cytoskeletal 10-like [Colias croceus]
MCGDMSRNIVVSLMLLVALNIMSVAGQDGDFGGDDLGGDFGGDDLGGDFGGDDLGGDLGGLDDGMGEGEDGSYTIEVPAGIIDRLIVEHADGDV